MTNPTVYLNLKKASHILLLYYVKTSREIAASMANK